MTRWVTFAAICISSVLGAGLMYAGGEALGTLLDRENPVWTAGGVSVLIALILMINYRYAQSKSRAGTHSNSRF